MAIGDTYSFVVGDQLAEDIGSTPLQVKVTVTEVDYNSDGDTDVQVDLEVVSGYSADLRGFFFNVNNNSLLTANLSIEGDDVTGFAVDINGAAAPNITAIDGVNVNPAGPWEVALEIGEPGAGPDFIPTTTFYIDSSSSDVTLADLAGEALGIRATSVGSDGEGSSKLIGIFEPDPDPVVYEGLSHGYWKNHVSDWDGVTGGQSFEAYFGVDVPWLKVGKTAAAADYTFAEALSLQGGGVNALAREAVAAILNASDEDIDYAYTVAEIIAMVQAVDFTNAAEVETLKNLLESNNTIGDIV